MVAYILVVSVGLSILFNRNASSGGLDIVAKIMNKFLGIELGKAMSFAGMCVALSSCIISKNEEEIRQYHESLCYFVHVLSNSSYGMKMDIKL